MAPQTHSPSRKMERKTEVCRQVGRAKCHPEVTSESSGDPETQQRTGGWGGWEGGVRAIVHRPGRQGTGATPRSGFRGNQVARRRVPATRVPTTAVPTTRVPTTRVPSTRVLANPVPATRVSEEEKKKGKGKEGKRKKEEKKRKKERRVQPRRAPPGARRGWDP